ncbi:stage V sporulation protein AD [Ruminococcaceae bacterium OttesenSCG-928-L11]|nr:stage V sporulation protein AD [Ruminococcaceae bacterium OttesenSCG-928-L11]
MATRIGKYTLRLDSSPSLVGYAAIASKKESEGPLASYIDVLNDDPMFGQKTWEMAESRMQQEVAEIALRKCSLSPGDISYLFAGDLLNQCIGSHYGMREIGIPFLGLYGACSTMAEGLALSALFVDTDIAANTMAVTSSHFCSSERQFRFPLAYGGQRPPTAQWTVTGAGAAIVGKNSVPPYVKAVTIGTIEDKGVKDISNMGSAMAPAAAQTLTRYFSDTLTNESNYDLILTGDLAGVGSDLLLQLMRGEGYDIRKKHSDCGLMIYDMQNQGVDAGGSGCGCSATVLCSYILQSMREGRLNDVLFIATGALMSTVSVQQGQSIPAIAHLVHLSTKPN